MILASLFIVNDLDDFVTLFIKSFTDQMHLLDYTTDSSRRRDFYKDLLFLQHFDTPSENKSKLDGRKNGKGKPTSINNFFISFFAPLVAYGEMSATAVSLFAIAKAKIDSSTRVVAN